MPDPFLLVPAIVWIIAIGFGGLILLVFAIFFFKFAGLWIQSVTTKAGIGFIDLIGMHFRKVNPTLMVKAKIAAVQAGIPSNTKDFEAHYLAGGNVVTVVRALIAADRANIKLDYKMATGIDPFASAHANWREAVRQSLDAYRRDDGGYAKGPEGQKSSTYHTFLVLLCLELIERPVGHPEEIVRFLNQQRCEGGGFREIRVSKRSFRGRRFRWRVPCNLVR